MLFRVVTVAVALTPFVIFELVCVAMGWGRPDDHEDPLVGFSGVRPLFVQSDDKAKFHTAPGRLEYFRPDEFSAKKPPKEFRIFCLGGSTVQGRPFAIETSFTSWLEIALRAAEPQRKWRVVNCGGVSYASYRLAPILQEVLQYEPDLIILYTGHNEFLEDRTYQAIKNRSALRRSLDQTAANLRTVTLLRNGVWRLTNRGAAVSEARPILKEEVDALLDYRGGLEDYHFDPAWRQGVIEHFEFNLRRMAQMCRRAGTPLLLVNPVTNLRDCPPFKSLHDPDLSSEDQRRFDQLWESARKLYRSDLRKATRRLRQAEKIDPHFAGVHFELGKCYDALGRLDEARQAYIEAKERDICPLRILEPMHAAVFRTAEDFQFPVVDVRKFVEEKSRGGIPGGYHLVDHVHPAIPVHRIIANTMAEKLADLGYLNIPQGWEKRRDRQYAQHHATLDDFYFAQGQQRLENLRQWAAGQGSKKRTRTIEPVDSREKNLDHRSSGSNGSEVSNGSEGSPPPTKE